MPATTKLVQPVVRPYNPVKRITPASSVNVPLTRDEIERYNNEYGLGAQKLLGKKRKLEESTDEPPSEKFANDAGMVADHYNERPEVGVHQRFESPIIGLRNFNNWIKSVLISRKRQASGTRSRGKVLDMGIGKGGDLNKWAKARIREMVGADVAAISIEQARARWEAMRAPRFEATFVALDCYSEPLSKGVPSEKLKHPFDTVSMQFCMHYAFETEEEARCMLGNVAHWLRPGGVFIGTIPNASELIQLTLKVLPLCGKRLDRLPADAEELQFGNAVYSVRFDKRTHPSPYGHRYMFYLRDAVENVPEYVVYWDDFVRLAAEFQLRLTYKQEFHHVFKEHRGDAEFGPLMIRMKVVDPNGVSAMDEDQWDAANIYLAFAFEKF